MSVAAQQWVLEGQHQVTGLHRLVLLILAYHHNKSGQCNPSLRTLSNEAGCSRKQLLRVLLDLENSGFFARQESWRRSGSRASNQYDLALEKARIPLVRIPAERSDTAPWARECHHPGVTDVPRVRVTDDTRGVSRMTPPYELNKNARENTHLNSSTSHEAAQSWVSMVLGDELQVQVDVPDSILDEHPIEWREVANLLGRHTELNDGDFEKTNTLIQDSWQPGTSAWNRTRLLVTLRQEVA